MAVVANRVNRVSVKAMILEAKGIPKEETEKNYSNGKRNEQLQQYEKTKSPQINRNDAPQPIKEY